MSCPDAILNNTPIYNRSINKFTLLKKIQNLILLFVLLVFPILCEDVKVTFHTLH